MLIDTTSSFVKYTLTESERKAGSHFAPEQKAVIQNMIADIAEEKISLTYDPDHPLQFTQREAELTGQIGILKYLLELHKTFTE